MGSFKTDSQKFDLIPDTVRKGLRQCTKSITEIEQEHNRIYRGDVIQRNLRERRVWNNKRDIDMFVTKELDLSPNSYEKTELRIFYQRVVNVITEMRNNGELIDWRYSDHMSRGPRYGIWRLAEPAEVRVITEFRDEDYSSPPALSIVAKRTKKDQFRIKLLTAFQHCLFCGFKLNPYLRAAHIVPFNVMQKKEPLNSMNPTNGLLLCTMCDVAFETGGITVDGDYHIWCDKELTSSALNTTEHQWVSSIDKILQIRKKSKLIPDPRYLEWKMRLVKK